MDEIKLTCETCGAQYKLATSALPPAGREVQCTACGHTWLARPHAAPPASAPALAPVSAPAPGSTIGSDPADPQDPAPAEPRLSRPLPANVLAILRDEFEFERRARAAEAGTGKAPPLPAAETQENDWPATTLRWPAPPATAAPGTAHRDPTLPPQPAEAAPMQLAAPLPQDRRAYRTGFGLAAMIGALLLSFYLLAPSLGDAGPMGARLTEARANIDDARLRLRAALLGAE